MSRLLHDEASEQRGAFAVLLAGWGGLPGYRFAPLPLMGGMDAWVAPRPEAVLLATRLMSYGERGTATVVRVMTEGAFEARLKAEREQVRAEVEAELTRITCERNAFQARTEALRAFADDIQDKARFSRVEMRDVCDLAYKAMCADEWAARPAVFGKLFADAGMAATLTAIPNEYWPKSYDEAGDPWFMAATDFGPVKIGWRKRVINIDWSAWPEAPDGRKVFVREQDGDFVGRTTVWEAGVHAWSYEKAVEYLRRLREAAQAAKAVGR